MKKSYILAATFFLLIFLAIFIAVSIFRSQTVLDLATVKPASQNAFYAAETGIEEAMFLLRAGNHNPYDPATRPHSGDEIATGELTSETGQTLGTYTVNMTADAYEIVPYWILPVEATGTESQSGKNLTRRIRAELRMASPAVFFISTLGELTFKDGARVNSNVLARIFRFIPAANPDSIHIGGDAIYLTSYSGWPDPNVVIDDGIDDNGNGLTGDDDIYRGQPFTFTGLDLDSYAQIASQGGIVIGTPTSPQNYNIEGDINRTLAPNGVIFIYGNANVKGTIKESMIIVTTQDIRIMDNIITDQGLTPSPQLGLYAGQDVIIDSAAPVTLNVEAFVRADGGVFEAEGGQFSKETLNFTGAISVRGAGEGESAINLDAYKIRSYFFNESLVSANTLPVKDFYVNIRNWQEVQ